MTHKQSPNAGNRKNIAGRYEHHKLTEYEVAGRGTHTETQEKFVVYRSDDMPEGEYWIRPEEMFFETIAKDGMMVARFKKKDD